MESKNYLNKILDELIIYEFEIEVNNSIQTLRTPIYSTRYYLKYVLLILKGIYSWKTLIFILYDKLPYHYKTIQAKHLEWCKLGIYKKVFNTINKVHFNKLKGTSNLVLFIDSTSVYNKNGIENIGYGYNPKKKETRFTAVCDNNKNIYSLDIINSRFKSKNRKTFPHDCKTLENTIKSLCELNIKFRTLKLVGDKGYIINNSDKKYFYDKYKVQVVFPNRKNQKIKTSDENKKLLKNRYKIENIFAKLKQYQRIYSRSDKSSISYMGFVYLAAIINFKN